VVIVENLCLESKIDLPIFSLSNNLLGISTRPCEECGDFMITCLEIILKEKMDNLNKS
jgi:hypothetical protein